MKAKPALCINEPVDLISWSSSVPAGDICCVSCRVYFSILYKEDITFSRADVIFLTNAVMSKNNNKKTLNKQKTPTFCIYYFKRDCYLYWYFFLLWHHMRARFALHPMETLCQDIGFCIVLIRCCDVCDVCGTEHEIALIASFADTADTWMGQSAQSPLTVAIFHWTFWKSDPFKGFEVPQK